MQVSRYIAPFSQHSLTSAMLDDLDRHVDQEVAAAEQRIQHAAVVLARQALLDELDAVLRSLLAARVLRRDDGDALGRDADVPQDERQHALADAAETDEQDAPGKSTCTL